MPDPGRTFRSFLDGELPAPDFEQRLYQDPEIEAALSALPAPDRNDPTGETLYFYLISLNYQSAEDIRKAKRALAQVANRREKSSSLSGLWACDFEEPNPPVTEELISRVESLLDVKLPRAYITLMREQNGAYLNSNKVTFAEPPSQTMKYYTGEGSISLGAIFGLNHDPDASGGVAQTLRLREEWDVPQGLVLIDGDGHTWVALDYRNSKDEPSVVFYISESGEHATIARNFDDFVKALQVLPDDDSDGDD